MLGNSLWLSIDVSDSCAWDVVRVGDAKLVAKWMGLEPALDQTSKRQCIQHMQLLLMMMMMLHTPVQSSGTVTTHAPKRCILATMQGLSNSDEHARSTT
jgi:hypothetical protein